MIKTDWTRPEQPEVWVTAWQGLHDATLLSLESNHHSRTLDLTLDLGFPNPQFEYPKTITLHFEEVSYALIFGWFEWPGRQNEEDRAKHRVETLSIRTFNKEFAGQSPEGLPYGRSFISDAQYSQSPDKFWLTIDGTPERQGSWRLDILGRKTRVLFDERSEMSFEELLRIGEAGWKAFSQ